MTDAQFEIYARSLLNDSPAAMWSAGKIRIVYYYN
jgi:hypothetical protein